MSSDLAPSGPAAPGGAASADRDAGPTDASAAAGSWSAQEIATAGGLAPLVPRNPAGAALLAALARVEHNQWRPAMEVLTAQLRQARRLLDHAQRTVPFYSERLGAAGLRPDEEMSLRQWFALPRLTRADIVAAGRALHTRQLPKGHGRVGRVTTSGSTGTPVTALRTRRTQFQSQVLTLRNHLWHGRDLTQRICLIHNTADEKARYPGGRRRNGWGRSTDKIYRTGPASMLAVTTPVEQQVEWLVREAPSYLVTFPSNAEALARHCLDAGIEIPTLSAVNTLGEVVTPVAREEVRRAWNVPIIDVYSTEELNYIALQCPGHEHYHVQSENVLVEVVDDNGRQAPPGVVGKVLVTALYNYAMPLIRYEIGDYAEFGAPCPCGRSLPVLERIMGRVRNMLVLPDGRRFWPSLGDAGYADVAPIRQFQFVQKTVNHIEVRLVVHRTPSAAEERALRDLVRSRLGHPFDLTLTYHDEILRGAGGKYEDFKSEIGG